MRLSNVRVGIAGLVLMCAAGCSGKHPGSVPSASTGSSSPSVVTSVASSQPAPGGVQARIRVEVDGKVSAAEATALAPLATSPEVLRGVIIDLHLTTNPEDTAKFISAAVDPLTGYLVISSTGPDAAEIANSDAVNLVQAARIAAPNVLVRITQPA